MELIDHNSCTGCGACKEACPKQAIRFQDDPEGFPTPYIVQDICVECGLCRKVCPALEKPRMNEITDAYAVQLLDRETLKESTSGGVFTALAKEIFQRKGIVYGCIWDEEYRAVVCKAENLEETAAMRGSKYVWSWSGDTFIEIRRELEEGRTVLFTGLPCQAAGLRKYLSKEYSNLYIAAFFCGGSPSPLAFREYLKTIVSDVNPYEKLHFKFRDKEKHGVGVHISYQHNGKTVDQGYVRNPYYFSFYAKVFNRKCCYRCQYRYGDRVDDLTFGDYWGVGEYHNEFDIKAGVSALLVNSEKGRELFEAVRNQFQISETRAENIAAHNNLTLGDRKVSFSPPPFRDAFFAALKKNGWKTAERRHLYSKTRLKLWLKTKIPSKYQRLIRKMLAGHIR